MRISSGRKISNNYKSSLFEKEIKLKSARVKCPTVENRR